MCRFRLLTAATAFAVGALWLSGAQVLAAEKRVFGQKSGGLSFGFNLGALGETSSRSGKLGKRGQNLLVAITKAEEKNITNRAFPKLSAKWRDGIAYVCWENPDEDNAAKRQLVRQAVTETWMANSKLDLRGWNRCVDASIGIRIKVEDSGPHVKHLGNEVDKIKDGMVLNFSFKNWNRACQTKVDECIRAIAVHEFGHAIGFSHEQNRPDTPGECFEFPQGEDGDTPLPPWDQNSVMNYCSEKYLNDGKLSEFDIKAVQFIYGAPS